MADDQDRIGIRNILIYIIIGLSLLVKIGKGDDARYFGIKSGYIEFLFNRANILTGRAMEAKYEERDRVVDEMKKEYKIVQEITEETKKIARAITHIKDLEN